MNRHKHAASTPIGRGLVISRVREGGWTIAAAADADRVSRRTGYKWLARFDAEGLLGLQDRSSRSHRSPSACWPSEVCAFEAQRRRRLPLWRIAKSCRRSLATVARYMGRAGLSRLKSPASPSKMSRTQTRRATRLTRSSFGNAWPSWNLVDCGANQPSPMPFAASPAASGLGRQSIKRNTSQARAHSPCTSRSSATRSRLSQTTGQ